MFGTLPRWAGEPELGSTSQLSLLFLAKGKPHDRDVKEKALVQFRLEDY